MGHCSHCGENASEHDIGCIGAASDGRDKPPRLTHAGKRTIENAGLDPNRELLDPLPDWERRMEQASESEFANRILEGALDE